MNYDREVRQMVINNINKTTPRRSDERSVLERLARRAYWRDKVFQTSIFVLGWVVAALVWSQKS